MYYLCNISVFYCFTYDGEGKIVRQVKYYNDVINGTWDYEYDDLYQLIREDNHPLSRTYVYEYDNAGNIVSKYEYKITYSDEITTALLSTDSYTYSTSAWGDLLTSYNGTAITYDSIGNPLSYYNGSSYTFTWNGRQLATAVMGTNTMSFTYNVDKQKTIDYCFCEVETAQSKEP